VCVCTKRKERRAVHLLVGADEVAAPGNVYIFVYV